VFDPEQRTACGLIHRVKDRSKINKDKRCIIRGEHSRGKGYWRRTAPDREQGRNLCAETYERPRRPRNAPAKAPPMLASITHARKATMRVPTIITVRPAGERMNSRVA